MKALAKLEQKQGAWMIDADIPEPGHNEVRIKITKTAICGTDMHIYHWDEWAQQVIPPGLIFGHEFIGTIDKLGDDVEGFQVGDRVSGEGHISCGHCRRCRNGKRHLCRNSIGVGVQRQGCFAEYLVIPAVNAYPIPDEVSDEVASILDPLGNATHCALSFDLIGEDVLITGAGPVGMFATAVARHVGARNIVVTDVNDYRLSLAKKLGATRVVNAAQESLENVMKELNMTEGFDVGLEMSGNPQAFNSMLNAMNHGGSITLLGFLPKTTQIDWNEIILKGLIVKGIYGREMFGTWYKNITMLQSGLDVTSAITHSFNIDDFQKGFDIMASGKSGKVILDWT